jgi:general secretion pathway protein G
VIKVKDKRAAEAGFTLIEVIVVVIIIGFLAGTVGPNLFSRVAQSRKTTARNQMEIFELALDNYRLDNGRYPTSQQGLEALVEQPTSSPVPKNWNGPYLEDRKIPQDPWGNDYQYEFPGDNNQQKYDLWSWGADGERGGEGENADITNW